MDTVLTNDELFAITGFKRKGKQREWLKANGFKFKLNRYDQPRVDRRHYELKMGASTTAANSAEPNWGRLKAA